MPLANGVIRKARRAFRTPGVPVPNTAWGKSSILEKRCGGVSYSSSFGTRATIIAQNFEAAARRLAPDQTGGEQGQPLPRDTPVVLLKAASGYLRISAPGGRAGVNQNGVVCAKIADRQSDVARGERQAPRRIGSSGRW